MLKSTTVYPAVLRKCPYGAIIELFRYFHTFREAELNPGGGGGGDLGGNFEHAKIHRIDQILKGTPFVF